MLEPTPHPRLRTAILGAGGYTGAELLRLLARHPYVDIILLTADSQANKPMTEIYPHVRSLALPVPVRHEAADFSAIDLVFCCLPHGTSQEIIAALPPHVRIIDLSADFRLADPALYEEWYGHPHRALHLQRESVYGLSEHDRAGIAAARLVANPGCYPTSVLLPLIPLVARGLIRADTITIDAKSGMTGAGRAAKQAHLFTEINEGVSAYSLGAHRHMPEMEQELSRAAGAPVRVSFTPHLMPMNRGMLSTMYVTLAGNATVEQLRAALRERYAGEAFIDILDAGQAPSTHQVRGTNRCAIGVFADRIAGRAILVSAIDNLGKGASGQAVQNMNLMHGWPETLALEDLALFP